MRRRRRKAGWPVGEYLYSHRHKLILATIPRVGCRTAVRWWYAIHGQRVQRNGSRAHAVMLYGMHRHSRDRWGRIMLGARRIAFVRDPWQRAVSAYLSKFVNSSKFRPGVHLTNRYARNTAAGLSFEDFVRLIGRQAALRMNQHWRPVTLFLGDCHFDALWPLAEMTSRLRALGADLKCPSPIITIGRTPHQAVHGGYVGDWSVARLRQGGQPYPHWQDFYTDELVALVARVYASDVTRFQLQFPNGRESDSIPPI